MTSKADSIYCSGLLPVLSIEAIEAERGKPLPDRIDPTPDPETKLVLMRDLDRLMAFVRGLPRDLAEVALGLLDGQNQATIARRLKLSEPAITKRIKRIARIGKVAIPDLRRSPLLT